ncbi:hypothetical protein DL767_006579 [Monosporascus sp. MG133]|nr:hypothetical protein DL767_006579 [Monosporascus sp. MG133]
MDNAHWDTISNHILLSWLNEVRAIRATHLVSDPVVTGVGYLSSQQEVCTPRDEGRRYDYKDRVLSDGDAPSHDACWELLRDRIDPGRQVPPDTIARHLFALLYNAPTNGEGTLVSGHDYGGAAQFQRPPQVCLPPRYAYFTIVDSSGLPYLTGDPREELQRDEDCMWEAIQAMSAPFNLPGMSLGNYSDSDVFCSLPNKTAMHILEYLASSDVGNVRLASRYVADTSEPNLLPQEFWASRFWPESEMGFVFAQPFCPRPSKLVDWRVLYIKAKATLSNSELFPGFRNRKRIWHNPGNLSDALRIRIENEDWVTDTPYRDPRLVMPPASRLGAVLSAETSLEVEHSGSLASQNSATNIEPKEGELLTTFCGKVIVRRDAYPAAILKFSGIPQVDISTISLAVAKWYKARFSRVLPGQDPDDSHDPVTKEFFNPTTGASRGITWGCNHAWDQVRILYGPRPGSRGNPLITVPPPSRGSGGLWYDRESNLESWMVPEKAFMVEGESGAEDGEGPLIAIEVSYKGLSADPAGLTLVYRGGAKRTLSVLGKRPQRQELLPGETLMRMEVGLVRGNRIAFLSFFTNTNRKLHFSDAWAPTTATTTTPAPQLSSPACVLAEAGRTQGTGDGVNGVQGFTRMDGAGASVGLWAVPSRNDRSLRHNLLGPLFKMKKDGGEG